jgi:hypothetical protein
MAKTNTTEPSAYPGLVTGPTDDFYGDLVPFGTFANITNPECYRSLPNDWIIDVADCQLNAGDCRGTLQGGQCSRRGGH